MRDLLPKDWRIIDDVVGAHEAHPERVDDVFDAFIAAAFRREIPWEKDRDRQPTGYAKIGRLRARGMSRFMRAMAERASTADELGALFDALDCAWANGMAGATGAAGNVLLDRASRVAGTEPLPQGWRAVAEFEAHHNAGRSGAYWATHTIRAADLHHGPPTAGEDRQIG